MLWAINFLVLQWLGIRLCRVNKLTKPWSDGKFVRDGWGLMVLILPLSGWWSRYRGLVGPVIWWGGDAGFRWGRF